MFIKFDKDYLTGRCAFLSCGFKLFAAVLLTLAMAACDDDSTLPEPEPEPVPGFKIHIGEGNVVPLELDAPEFYPPMYQAVLVMEDLPADEEIIYMGSLYSVGNPDPDINDCSWIFDCTDLELFRNWEWEKEPLYWTCILFFHPVPDTTYYLRGYVQTNKGEYYSNTIEVRSSVSNPMPVNPDAYEIPVVFHLFPDAEGNYPIRDEVCKSHLDYANCVYSNYFNIPGQTDTGVRFVAATQAPDGTKLETPGIVYEKEAVEIDYQDVDLDDKYVWDPEQVLNVWVCPIKNFDGSNEYNTLGGFAFYPFFDADEVLEGCSELIPEYSGSGIFLNSIAMSLANNEVVFAHEAGHFLGLAHVFEPGDDFCDDTQWYDYDAHWAANGGDICVSRKNVAGEEFWSDNVMDYDYGFMTGFTPDQKKRIQYTLQHAYFIPGEAGKTFPAARSGAKRYRFAGKPVR